MSGPIPIKGEDEIALLDGFQAYWAGQLLFHSPVDGDDVSFGARREAAESVRFAGSGINFQRYGQIQLSDRIYSCGDDAAHGSFGHLIRCDLDGVVEWIYTSSDGPFERVWDYCGSLWAQSPSVIVQIDDGETIRIRTYRTWTP